VSQTVATLCEASIAVLAPKWFYFKVATQVIHTIRQLQEGAIAFLTNNDPVVAARFGIHLMDFTHVLIVVLDALCVVFISLFINVYRSLWEGFCLTFSFVKGSAVK